MNHDIDNMGFEQEKKGYLLVENKTIQAITDLEALGVYTYMKMLIDEGLTMIWGRLLELIEQKQTNILTMDDIFEGYTHTKAGRFDLLSRLVKKGIIRRNRIDNLHHEYVIIPKNTYRDSKEMRVYPIKTKAERLNVMREFEMNK